jgi:hypothetical protein
MPPQRVASLGPPYGDVQPITYMHMWITMAPPSIQNRGHYRGIVGDGLTTTMSITYWSWLSAIIPYITHILVNLSKGQGGPCAIDVPFRLSSCQITCNKHEGAWSWSCGQFQLHKIYVIIGYVEEAYHPISKLQLTRNYHLKSQNYSWDATII